MKLLNCYAIAYTIALNLVCLLVPGFANVTGEPPTSKTIFQSFESEEVINMEMIFDMDTLLANKMKNVYQFATVTIDSDFGLITQEIKVKARGRSRRTYCEFPPLKLKFPKEGLQQIGLNKRHNSLKLVTHCAEDANSQKNVLEEYLAYKLYSELTDASYKVQLVKVTYTHARTGESMKRFGIVLEDTDEMAERIGGKEDETMGMPKKQYQKEALNLLSVFQYMVGNEDWRPEFLRNIKHVQLPTGEMIPVPYDFDAAGIVNANYAKPDRDLRLETVLQRQFMGTFANKKERQKTIDFVQSKKEVLLKTIDTLPYMDAVSKKVASRYIHSFYDIIENRSKLNRAMPLKGRTPEATDVWGAM